jgi:hypothetical protein
MAVELLSTTTRGWSDKDHGVESPTGALPTYFSNLLGLLPGYNDTLGNISHPGSVS